MFCLLGNNIWPQDESAAQFWPVEGTEDTIHPWLAITQDSKVPFLYVTVYYTKCSTGESLSKSPTLKGLPIW